MHRYDPDDDGPREGARGRFYFPPSVVEAFARDARLPPGQRPRSRSPADVRRWLIDASLTATRKPDAEERRRDGRQVWRAGRAFARVYFVVDVESAEGELPVCVGAYTGGLTSGRDPE